MYTDSDLDAAVAAGAISAEAATAFRSHVADQRAAPLVDEEQFRLVTGFNDIFVSIAIILLLVAVGQIGERITDAAAGLLVAAASWGLAEYFTRVRRMALPSILLLLAFAGGLAVGLSTIATAVVGIPFDGLSSRRGAGEPASQQLLAGFLAVAAALTAAAAWLHWRRFQVPITIAAGAAAVVAVVVALFAAAFPRATDVWWAMPLIGGLGVFAFAMRWDLSDRERRTRRSDVAFWLHLVAAPLIAHPIFKLLGVFDGAIGIGTAIVVLALYVVFAIVALAIDRRALLVSGLAYVLYAMAALIRETGAVELSAALTALVIGSALLSLSAFWPAMRRPLVAALGPWGQRLPPTNIPATAIRRPAS